MNDLTVQPEHDALLIFSPSSALHPERFEQTHKMAQLLAAATVLPESLTMEDKKEIPYERIVANCFMIVDQAERWGMSAQAVIGSTSIVRGRLCFEGKLVASVIQAKTGVTLHHCFRGEGLDRRIYLSDVPFNEIVTTYDENGEERSGPLAKFLEPDLRIPGVRLADGSVKEWTTGDKGAWAAAKNHTRMLIYRGTREWCRFYEPALLLGVYTPDEMEDVMADARARRARDVTPLKPTVGGNLRLRPADDEAPEGFTHAGIEMEAATLRDAAENKAKDRVPELTAEERNTLTQLIRQCRAASTPVDGQAKLDPKVVVTITNGFDTAGFLTSKITRDKAGTIGRSFKSVCEGKTSLESAVEYTCGIVGVELSDLEKSE